MVRALLEPDFYQTSRRRHGDIFKASQFGQNVICVVSLDSCHQLMTQYQDKLEPCPLPFHKSLEAGFLRYMTPDVYQVYGPLFRKAMSREVQKIAGQATRAIAPTRFRKVVRGESDFQATLDHLVFHGFLESLFGLSPSSAFYDQFLTSYSRFSKQHYGEPPSKQTLHHLEELCQILRHQEQEAESASALAQFRSLEAEMPDQVCLQNLIYLVRMSVGNVVGLLQWLIALLSEHPEWLARIRDRDGSPDDVFNRVFWETLRLHQSEYLYRKIAQDFTFQNLRFPKGWLLRVCVRECHRDPQTFPQPNQFDPDRFLNRPNQKEYSPFGMLAHACNGITITKSICRAVVEELADGFELKQISPMESVRDFRHWSHWRPRMRVCVSVLGSDSPGAEIQLC